MDRREFVGICAGTVATPAAGIRSGLAVGMHDYPAARLVDAHGKSLKAADLVTDQAYLFHYPFRAVPCFLINLGKSSAAKQTLDGEDGSHVWPGGSGEDHNLVSYVAMCTHQLSYPNNAASVIRYAADSSELAGRPGMIVCCTHGSVFDPVDGTQRVSGPAEHPLIPVRLEVDPLHGTLSATGIDTTRLIERFFNAYKSDLIAQGLGAGTAALVNPGVCRRCVHARTANAPSAHASTRLVCPSLRSIICSTR